MNGFVATITCTAALVLMVTTFSREGTHPDEANGSNMKN